MGWEDGATRRRGLLLRLWVGLDRLADLVVDVSGNNREDLEADLVVASKVGDQVAFKEEGEVDFKVGEEEGLGVGAEESDINLMVLVDLPTERLLGPGVVLAKAGEEEQLALADVLVEDTKIGIGALVEADGREEGTRIEIGMVGMARGMIRGRGGLMGRVEEMMIGISEDIKRGDVMVGIMGLISFSCVVFVLAPCLCPP